jgi:heptosyltransferase-2
MTPGSGRTPGRVLVRAPNWLGDAVLALPAVVAVRRHFPGAHLAVAGPAPVAALFREVTAARPDEVIELPTSRKAAQAAIRAGQFDLGLLLPNSFQSAWALRRAGIGDRWGAATSGRGWLLTRKSAMRPHKGVEHHAEYFRDIVRGLGLAVDEGPPEVAASAATRAKTDALLGQLHIPAGTTLIGLAPGAAYGEAKQWPPDRAAALCARPVREHQATCLVLGAIHDREAARTMETWLRAQAPDTVSRVIDLAGRTSVRELVGLTERCRAFVSNDSGAMHVAAAVGCPVTALFGPTDERSTRPVGAHTVLTAAVFCRPCMLRDCPIDHRCMKRITVDQVFAAVSARLERPR